MEILLVGSNYIVALVEKCFLAGFETVVYGRYLNNTVGMVEDWFLVFDSLVVVDVLFLKSIQVWWEVWFLNNVQDVVEMWFVDRALGWVEVLFLVLDSTLVVGECCILESGQVVVEMWFEDRALVVVEVLFLVVDCTVSDRGCFLVVDRFLVLGSFLKCIVHKY